MAPTTNDAVRVLVVDDSATTRTMLREALGLAGGFDVVGEASDGPEAVASASELRPDVVLMDLRMPEGDGIQAAREITSRNPSTKIVALTWLDDAATVREMLAAGAMGYVVKGGTMDELADAIRRAKDGEAELDHRVLPAAVEDLRRLLEEEVSRREEVERLSRARGEFVQVLSHELRTPLTVITGALKMFRQVELTWEQTSVLDSAVRRAEQLEFLVQGLELVAGAPAENEVAFPREATRGALDRLGLTPDVFSADEDRWIGIPDTYVHRVAFELLSNAERHGRRPIEVRAFRNGLDGVIEVRDAGGWSAGAENFSAFFQEDMSQTRAAGGFGLGLFVSSRLCQACEGSLRIGEHLGQTVAEARFRMR
jgi:DNA-binding NarL/FixJ family response regulator